MILHIDLDGEMDMPRILKENRICVYVLVKAIHKDIVMDIMHIPGISALAVLLLAGAVTPYVMASQGYWTSNSSRPRNGLNIYHIFLVGSYPSSVNYIGYKLVNPNLTACLDFNPNYTNPKPVVCHPIKESEIPLKNDSVIDAGFFVVSDKLNASAATACVHIQLS